jgi:hypothetical protein
MPGFQPSNAAPIARGLLAPRASQATAGVQTPAVAGRRRGMVRSPAQAPVGEYRSTTPPVGDWAPISRAQAACDVSLVVQQKHGYTGPGQRKSRLQEATVRSMRPIHTATTVTRRWRFAPDRGSPSPTPSALAAVPCRHPGEHRMLTIPVSSSRLMNVTPWDVAGRCRCVTGPGHQHPGAGGHRQQLVGGHHPDASRTAMRRSDRAVAVMARRTPWILRGMARLTPATSRSSIRWATSAGEGISEIALSTWPGGDQRAAVVVDHRMRVATQARAAWRGCGNC